MIECDVGREEIEQRRKGNKSGDQSFIPAFLEKDQKPEKTEQENEEESIEKKNRTKSQRGIGSVEYSGLDRAASGEAIEQSDQRLGDIFIIRNVEKKISEHYEDKQNCGNDKALPGVCFPDSSRLGAEKEQNEDQCEEDKSFQASEGV